MIILLILFFFSSCLDPDKPCSCSKTKLSNNTSNNTKPLTDFGFQPTEEIMEIEETLTLSDYIIWNEKKSIIDPTQILHQETETMKCPYCQHVQRTPEHGETIKCPKCGMEMTVYGNAIKCKITTKKEKKNK
jgi:hypothetical protein